MPDSTTDRRRAARSGNPARRGQVTTAAQWKAQAQGTDLTVPSGNVCRVRVVGPDVFLKRGKMPDTLKPIIEAAIREGKGLRPQEVQGALTMDAINETVEYYDSVICEVVLAPKVYPVPEDDADRDPDLLYVDEVDFKDKMFIFQFVAGGTRDLESFRQQQATGVADVPGGEKLAD